MTTLLVKANRIKPIASVNKLNNPRVTTTPVENKNTNNIFQLSSPKKENEFLRVTLKLFS